MIRDILRAVLLGSLARANECDCPACRQEREECPCPACREERGEEVSQVDLDLVHALDARSIFNNREEGQA